MNFFKSIIKKVYHGLEQKPFVAFVVVIVSVIASINFWIFSNRFLNEKNEEYYHLKTNEIKEDISERLRIYGQVLLAGKGFFEASNEVTRSKWELFIKDLELQKNFPGIQGLGYTAKIEPQALENVISKMRADGFPQFNIRPVEPKRDEYHSILFLEPLDWRNERAIGYDMYTEKNRNKAMSRSRDTGETAMSGIVTLVQETEKAPQKGFLMYHPTYIKDKPLDTVENRRKYFIGFIYSPFRMNDFMEGILGDRFNLIQFEIFDGAEINPENRLFIYFKNNPP